MNQTANRLMLSVLLLPAWTAVAQPTSGDQAGVVTETVLPDDCLAPVVITKVDGITRAVPANGFLIEPGVHRINGRVTLDTSKCGPIEPGLKIQTTPDLVVDFETGWVYHIAYDRHYQNSGEWKLVVWKVERPDQAPDPMRP